MDGKPDRATEGTRRVPRLLAKAAYWLAVLVVSLVLLVALILLLESRDDSSVGGFVTPLLRS